VDGQIGGDAPLSQQGEKYMTALPALIKQKLGDTPLTVSFSLSLYSEIASFQLIENSEK